MCQDIIRYGQRNGINVIIDIKENDLEKYKGATIVKGNKKEIHKLLDKLSLSSTYKCNFLGADNKQ